MPSKTEIDYVVWQNRAFRFYVAARLLYRHALAAPAAFSATQALELLLKATLVYFDSSFKPETAGHAIAKLARTVRNKVPGANVFDIPRYFFHGQLYHTVSRYPKGSKGLFVPACFVDDLDAVFVALVGFVPFQHNTELKRALGGHNAKALAIIRRGNNSIRRLRKVIGIRAQRRPTQRPNGRAASGAPLS